MLKKNWKRELNREKNTCEKDEEQRNECGGSWEGADEQRKASTFEEEKRCSCFCFLYDIFQAVKFGSVRLVQRAWEWD